MSWDIKAKLREVEGFSLALNYTADDRRRQEWEHGREEGWNNTIHCRSYLSSLNRCRPGCSLYCSTKAFWQKKPHTHTQRHAHTSFWANQCTLVSVISQGALQCPPWVSEVTKAAREERSSYFLPSVFWPMYAFFLFFSFSLLISAHLYFSTMQLYCRERTMSVTSTQNAMFRHTDMYIWHPTEILVQ